MIASFAGAIDAEAAGMGRRKSGEEMRLARGLMIGMGRQG